MESPATKRPKNTDDDLLVLEADAVEDAGDGQDIQHGPDSDEDDVLENELRVRQAEIDECHAEMLEKLREVEARYEGLKRPLYKSRGDVIGKIPGFWLHCFMQHQRIKYILGSTDQDILSTLTKLEVEQLEEVNTGYKIKLHFAPNDFFEDEVLEKEIRFLFEEGQPVVCGVSGCKPRWKENDLTETEPVTKGRKRGRDPVTFMRWFTHEKTFEPGMVDTLADIIKDQIYLNPIVFMDSEPLEETEEDAGGLELYNEVTAPGEQFHGGNSDWEAGEEFQPEDAELRDEEEEDDGKTQLSDVEPLIDDELPDYEEGEEEEEQEEQIDLEPDIDDDGIQDLTGVLSPNRDADETPESPTDATGLPPGFAFSNALQDQQALKGHDFQPLEENGLEKSEVTEHKLAENLGASKEAKVQNVEQDGTAVIVNKSKPVIGAVPSETPRPVE